MERKRTRTRGGNAQPAKPSDLRGEGSSVVRRTPGVKKPWKTTRKRLVSIPGASGAPAKAGSTRKGSGATAKRATHRAKRGGTARPRAGGARNVRG